ncbi:lipid asymmetry ABC transporter MlaABCDEF, lipoprotein MlaA [Campylobacter iguaniorum]|uniref:Lipid asymmetry ABC transporter MlaABCDEF, lipoprotein MlaA n=1 Tax=Campylobacter iguaniorum TaxID=1244531 RepID=A0A076FEL9_9BACT|nr:VacJ family lipoprotein [Campylobacter iguaniorum]AII14289.1 lipid asymmetry ABC transporter MlaABCDEF, lipoprotein MlaA [Campylobacter iguaniorum]ALV24024.1 lipid asymmetry ABC transporter MlaABCDEF, lipoprotein MlaA [Campylobacter iguaniorum]
MKKVIIAVLFCSILGANETDISSFDDEFSDKPIFDPLSGYNRVMTDVNDFMYRNMFTPVFKGYDYIMPDEGQTAISNFFDNILFPIRFINNLLQFKFANAGEETLRFIANTVVGFGGISDVATNVYGLKKHDEDFGQTLGYWGVGSGFPVVIPILGQSNLRDIAGLGGDYFINPLSYSNDVWARDSKFFDLNLAIKTEQMINENSLDPEKYQKATSGAVDLYTFIKNAYEQRRNALIKE